MPIKRDLNAYFGDINAAVAEQTPKKMKSWKIENLFTPTYKDNKFSVVIRFLPSHPDEIKPYVENRKHTIKLPNNKWFITECLTKFGKPCPICNHNRTAYKTMPKEQAADISLGKAKSRYICNILVVRNANNTDTEGKVFRFEFGPQIMKMIGAAMTDREDEIEGLIRGFNPFDWETGANFVYTGVMGSNGPKLDDSHFGNQGPIDKWNGKKYQPLTVEEIDAIEAQLYRLDECYNKEEEVADFNRIVQRYEEKSGKKLLGLPEGGVPAAKSDAVDLAATNPFMSEASAPAAPQAPAGDDFDFDATPKETKTNINTGSIPEVTDDAFFADVDEEMK